MDSKGKNCSLCAQCHLYEKAVVWCPECEEALCESCKKPHGLSKSTKLHQTITVECYESLPAFVLDTPQTCIEHEQKFELFCNGHNIPICRKCVSSTHKGCEELSTIEEVINSERSSSILDEMIQTLNDMDVYIKNVSGFLKESKSKFTECHLDVTTKIRIMRTKINQHIDELEQKLLSQLSSMALEYSQSTDRLLEQLDAKKEQLLQTENNIKSIQKSASDFLVFLAASKLEPDVINQERNVVSLKDDKRMKSLSITLKTSNDFEFITSNIESLGELVTNQSSIPFTYKSWKEKQAQTLMMTRQKNIDDLQLYLEKLLIVPDVPNTTVYGIRGCAIVSETEFIFADYGSDRLVLMTIEGTCKKDISMKPTSAFDVCYTDNRIVVCTSLDHKTIEFVNVENGECIKTLSKSTKCGGVSHYNGTIMYALQHIGVRAYSISDENEVIIPIKVSKINHLALYKNNVYFTLHTSTNMVYCSDKLGNIIWEFKNTSVLLRPTALTVDLFGNIYVIGEKSCNVVVLSSDGKYHKQLLNKANGLLHPTGIDCDRQQNQLLVTNKDGTAFLFKIRQ